MCSDVVYNRTANASFPFLCTEPMPLVSLAGSETGLANQDMVFLFMVTKTKPFV